MKSWGFRDLPTVVQILKCSLPLPCCQCSSHHCMDIVYRYCLDSRIKRVYLLASKRADCREYAWPVCRTVPGIFQGHRSPTQLPAFTKLPAAQSYWGNEFVVFREQEVGKLVALHARMRAVKPLGCSCLNLPSKTKLSLWELSPKYWVQVCCPYWNTAIPWS